MQVERGHRLVLEHVDQIEPHRFPGRDPDRMVVVKAGHTVPGDDAVAPDLVVGEPGEDESDLGRRRSTSGRVHDHHPMEATGDVLGERGGVAVIGVYPGRAGQDLIGGLAPGGHWLPAVVLGEVRAVEVDVVGAPGVVPKPHMQGVTLGYPDDGSRDGPVVGPRLDVDAGAHLDQTLFDGDVDVTG
jgi:hypothetical protein